MVPVHRADKGKQRSLMRHFIPTEAKELNSSDIRTIKRRDLGQRRLALKVWRPTVRALTYCRLDLLAKGSG